MKSVVLSFISAGLLAACSQPLGGETWRYERQNDAIRDRTFTRATLGSNERVHQNGYEASKAGLYIEHGSANGDAIWLMSQDMNCSASQPVLVRFDGEEVVSFDCAGVTPTAVGQMFVLPSEMIQDVEAAQIMVVQFGVTSGAPNQVTFRVRGLDLNRRVEGPT